MAKRTGGALRRGGDGPYLRLIRALPLRPIRTDAELGRAIEVIDGLVKRPNLDPEEQDYLEVLSGLVREYESKHFPIRPVSDGDMLGYLLEEHGVTQKDLAQRTGIAESTISEVLAGKRKLNRRHITVLARIFYVSPAVFFSEEAEMSLDTVAEIIEHRAKLGLTPAQLESIAGAFAIDPDRACWRSFVELVAREVPPISPKEMADRLNLWGEGGDCWRPAAFHLTETHLRSLARVFGLEPACWRYFKDFVEAIIPDWRGFAREMAEEN